MLAAVVDAEGAIRMRSLNGAYGRDSCSRSPSILLMEDGRLRSDWRPGQSDWRMRDVTLTVQSEPRPRAGAARVPSPCFLNPPRAQIDLG